MSCLFRDILLVKFPSLISGSLLLRIRIGHLGESLLPSPFDLAFPGVSLSTRHQPPTPSLIIPARPKEGGAPSHINFNWVLGPKLPQRMWMCATVGDLERSKLTSDKHVLCHLQQSASSSYGNQEEAEANLGDISCTVTSWGAFRLPAEASKRPSLTWSWRLPWVFPCLAFKNTLGCIKTKAGPFLLSSDTYMSPAQFSRFLSFYAKPAPCSVHMNAGLGLQRLRNGTQFW